VVHAEVREDAVEWSGADACNSREMETIVGSGMKRLSHINDAGQAAMVDVSTKPVQTREAVALGEIHLQSETLALVEQNQIAKGNVLATARLAGIMAAKKTGELIPLCHPLPITHCEVNFEVPKSRDRIVITASAKIAAQTGVEMEALTAVGVAALTIYDMCKAVDKRMRITDIVLVSKTKSSTQGRKDAKTRG
jgi:cyclic pyranopterin phosphate synthase